MKLLDGIKGGIAVEVGVWRGDFSKVILDENPLALCLVDPWIPQSKIEYNDILNLDTVTNEQNYKFVKDRFRDDKKVYIMRQFSHEAVRDMFHVNYVYIDANHSFEYALADMFMWHAVIAHGGVLAGHDYSWLSVHTALDTFCKITKLKHYPVERDSWRIDL